MNRSLDTAKTAFQDALTLLRTGDAAGAERAARAALGQFPGEPNFLAVLGSALNRLQRAAEAEAVLRQAIAADPDYAKAHEALAHALIAQQRPAEAVPALRRAIALNPALKSAQVTLGQALLATGAEQAAADAFDELMQEHPQMQELADAATLHRDGQFEQAEAAYRDLLKRNPQDVAVLRLLGLLAIDTGHFRNAATLLKQAVELAPGFHGAWIELSKAQTELHELGDAIASAERAIAIEPQRAPGHVALANALAHTDRADEAIASYRRAQEIRPDNPEIALGLGNVLKTHGRQAEAIAAYRDGIRLKPDFAELYWSLSNLKTFRFEPGEIRAMELALASDSLPENAIVHFCFALGKACEDQSDYPRAFSYFKRGNELRRMQEYYDPVNTDQIGERIRATFTPELVARLRGSGHAGVAPIFVIGLPRSGSTLIEQILASHSAVEATAELPEGGRLVRFIDRQRVGGKVYPEAVAAFTGQALAEIGRRYDEGTRRYRSGKPRFIDKMPNNFATVGLLALALPDARFINAARDPRDTCLSCYKQLFARGQPFTYDLTEIGDYYLEYRRMIDHWHAVLPGRVLDVQYESVVADLEGQARRLLAFCDLPWEDACLRYYATERAVRTASSEQVRRPIYGDAIGVWRHYQAELAPLLEVLAPVLPGPG
jgi:tetratricopeptide (TPR) repeat protein